MCADLWNRCEISKKPANNLVKDLKAEYGTECGAECGTGNLSCTDLAHNVSFPAKLGNFPEILCYQNCSVWGVDLWNWTEILID